MITGTMVFGPPITGHRAAMGDNKVHDDEAEDREAQQVGREGGPQDADDMAAADGLQASPETAKNYEEALERGAAQQGEGRIP